MDHIPPRDMEFEVDLENGNTFGEEDGSMDFNSGVRNQAKVLLTKVCGWFIDGVSSNNNNSDGITVENGKLADGVTVENGKMGGKKIMEKKVTKEKRKRSGNKKHPKPPRPPKGPSLDAADQILIREIAEVAMLKRARIERMKAVKKMKAAKFSSTNSGNLLATVFTIIFCLVIIFQGMPSKGTSASSLRSPVSAATVDSMISVQYSGISPVANPNEPGSRLSNYFVDTTASQPSEPKSGTPSSVEQVTGSDSHEKLSDVVKSSSTRYEKV